MSFKKNIKQKLTQAININTFNRFCKKLNVRLFAFTYHTITETENPLVKNLYKTKNTRQFTDDLEFLLKNFRPISVETLKKRILNNQPIPRNSFLITFDDGFKEAAEIAAPILKNKGIPAIFFVTTSLIDNQSMFYRNKVSLLIEHIENQKLSDKTINEQFKQTQVPFLQNAKQSLLAITYKNNHEIDHLAQLFELNTNDYLKKYRPYFTTQQVQTLLKEGFTIGGHTIDHPRFSEINFTEQIRQTTESLTVLQQKFQLKNNFFAFPFDSLNVTEKFFTQLIQQNKIDLFFGSEYLSNDIYPQIVQRIWLENTSQPVFDVLKNALIEKIYHRMKKTDPIKRS